MRLRPQTRRNHRSSDEEELAVTQSNKVKTCISRCYLSLSCWKCCGLHFEDSYDEQLFLDKNYFRSKAYIGFSSAFGLLQLLAFAFFLYNKMEVDQRNYYDNMPMMIGSGIDGVLILGTQIIDFSCMRKGRRPAECVLPRLRI